VGAFQLLRGRAPAQLKGNISCLYIQGKKWSNFDFNFLILWLVPKNCNMIIDLQIFYLLISVESHLMHMTLQ
jgi:hypothetical protein